MKAKEKAKELVEKFRDFADPNYHECAAQWELSDSIKQNSKQCALISVDEILSMKIVRKNDLT